MAKRKATDWIVTKKDLSLNCERCGSSYKFTEEVKSATYIDLATAFINIHKDCTHE